MGWIGVSPADRFRPFVVVPDVTPNLARQIRDRRKDAAGQQVALDFGKPD
jgi:hypothetical protein